MNRSKQVIGMKKGTVVLNRHDSRWGNIAQNTIKELSMILDDSAVAIEHVGSTSIKNIFAKPIIDIVVGIDKLDSILKKIILENLEKQGYIHDPERDNDEKIFFYKNTGDLITHHIHVVVHKQKAWNSYTKLRDYLNEHPDEAKRYESIKLEQMKNCQNDISKYHDGKAEFLKEITAKALKTL